MEADVDGRLMRWTAVRRKHCMDILKFIASYSAERGYMPSRREIGAGSGVTASSVNYYLEFMVEDGVVTVERKASRAIRITDKGFAVLSSLDLDTQVIPG